MNYFLMKIKDQINSMVAILTIVAEIMVSVRARVNMVKNIMLFSVNNMNPMNMLLTNMDFLRAFIS